jgi:hypothetical protein
MKRLPRSKASERLSAASNQSPEKSLEELRIEVARLNEKVERMRRQVAEHLDGIAERQASATARDRSAAREGSGSRRVH